MIRYIFPLLISTGLFMNLRAPTDMPDDYTGPYSICQRGHVVYAHGKYGYSKEYQCEEYKPGGCGWHQ